MIVYIYNIGVDLYNGFNGLRHRINWTYFTVLDGLAHPLYSVKVKDIMLLLGNENCNYVKNKYGNIYQFVEKLERQTVKKLSSGEKKVVEIFSSLALHKKYLLLDEVSNALDITNRQFLLDALISVSQKDIVVFYVSHNLNEIIKLNGEVYCFIPKFKTIKKFKMKN